MDARAVWRAPDDLGVTVPLLLSLVESYADRRRRELAEDATAGALAHHDPKGIDALRARPEDNEDPEGDSEFVRPDWGTHG